MISVTSCSASQTSWRNVLGGLGGITLDPNTSLRRSKSSFPPDKPEKSTMRVKLESFSYFFLSLFISSLSRHTDMAGNFTKTRVVCPQFSKSREIDKLFTVGQPSGSLTVAVLLIHEADPHLLPVLIIIFTFVVRTSVPTFSTSFQGKRVIVTRGGTVTRQL